MFGVGGLSCTTWTECAFGLVAVVHEQPIACAACHLILLDPGESQEQWSSASLRSFSEDFNLPPTHSPPLLPPSLDLSARVSRQVYLCQIEFWSPFFLCPTGGPDLEAGRSSVREYSNACLWQSAPWVRSCFPRKALHGHLPAGGRRRGILKRLLTFSIRSGLPHFRVKLLSRSGFRLHLFDDDWAFCGAV